MTHPVRLQLSRRKGFSLQRLSLETNGLPAVSVARPGKWGNPFRTSGPITSTFYCDNVFEAVIAYRNIIDGVYLRRDLPELKGKNLGCWCRPDSPCHADVLLEKANA